MAIDSLLVSSLHEIHSAIEQGFTGPVLVIPFGADETTPCRFYGSVNEVGEEELLDSLSQAIPSTDRKLRVHVLRAPPRFNPGPTFYRTCT